jgi:hypothetical protein
MANKVEELTYGIQTDQDKCIAIASWVCENISSRQGKLLTLPEFDNEYTWYAERTGLCGARSKLFVKMLEFLNIPAQTIDMYDFPDARIGHVAAQAWYEGKWHFFDVTWWGGYFLNGSDIMNFEKILENPKRALENMVVFPNGLDRYSDSDSKDEAFPEKISNEQRMAICYNLDSLTNFSSYVAINGRDVVEFYPKVDLSGVPYKWGEIDGTVEDVRAEALETGASQFIAFGLGEHFPIKANWQF